MPFVAFLGCDGSGKSAVISGVSARLLAEGQHVRHGHWRPVAFGRANPATGAEDPHGAAPRGLPASILKLGWLWLHWWVAWWRGLRAQSTTGLLLFDRYHADLIVDPKRYRYGGPSGLARLASRLMPQPDLVLYLDAEPAVLRGRKQEVGMEALESARSAYLDLAAANPRVRVLDASQTLPAVIESACGLIRQQASDTRHPRA